MIFKYLCLYAFGTDPRDSGTSTPKPMIKIQTTRFLFYVTIVMGLLSTSSCYHGTTQSAPPPPQAQVRVMPPPPSWAPPYEYQDRVRYYYIPDMQCYYDVYSSQYVYYDGYVWIHNSFPPPAYSGYDMNTGYVVVLNYNVSDPWMNNNTYVTNYPRGYYNNPSYNGGNGGDNQPRRGYNENGGAYIYHSNGNTRPTNSNPGNGNTRPTNSNPGNGNTRPTNSDPGNGNTRPTNSNPGNGNTRPVNADPSDERRNEEQRRSDEQRRNEEQKRSDDQRRNEERKNEERKQTPAPNEGERRDRPAPARTETPPAQPNNRPAERRNDQQNAPKPKPAPAKKAPANPPARQAGQKQNKDKDGN
jgi:hypothetical protein